MVSCLYFGLYRLWKRTGLRGRGWLLRSARYLPERWRRIPFTSPGNVALCLDLAQPEALPLLDFALGDRAQLDALLTVMARVLKPDSVLWDVGGNVGLVSLHFTHPAYQLREIHIFEPIPHLAEHLSRLFAATITHVHAVALGECEGTGVLHIPLIDTSTASLVQGNDGCERLEVAIVSGDQLITNQLAVPDVIKIDVEGFEPQVIRGLRETICQHRPILFFEHLFLDNGAIQALCPEGYTLRFIADRDASLSCRIEDRTLGHNAVFVPVEKLPLLEYGALE